MNAGPILKACVFTFSSCRVFYPVGSTRHSQLRIIVIPKAP